MQFPQTFQHELLDTHLGAMKPDDIAILAAAQQTGDVDILLEWYWGRKFLPAVKPMYYAPQPNQFWLGSWASGKTTNMAAFGFTNCLTKSYFKFVNLAPIGRQARLMYDFLRDEIVNNDKLEHLLDRVVAAPYPQIRFRNGSTMEFLTAKPEYLDYLEGEEFDQGNIDEGALIADFAETVKALRSRLRGIRQRTQVPRLCLLTITTVPGTDDVLKERYERGLGNNPDHISIKILAKHNPFVTEEQLRLIIADTPEEDVPTYIECEWPEVRGRLLPARHYDNCESVEMMEQMDDLIEHGVMGADYQEVERIGCVRWELPYEDGHVYITAGDPGSGNPPKRGSGVVMSWDVTAEPAELVYLDWVYGNGSIGPWMTSFKYGLEKYPGHSGFDTTGTQKYMDELVFEREGIIVEPLNFRRDKFGFLNALRMVLELRGMSFPFIRGMKSQARKYDLPDDKIAQDLVACLMMSAWMIRPLRQMKEPRQDNLPYLWARRGIRRANRGVRRGR